MLGNLGDVLEKTSNKGDVAVVLIAGTAGFLVDAGLNFVGFLSPGMVGVSCASGALGLKKGVESMIDKYQSKNENAKNNDDQIHSLEHRVDQLKKILYNKNEKQLLSDLEYEYSLFKDNLISLDELNATIKSIVQKLRKVI